MNKTHTNKFFIIAAVILLFASCKKDEDPIIVVPPSGGSTMQLNGLIGSESGSSAGNAVFVDLSADKQTSIARSSWDLGFYTGSEYKVKVNNTTVAYVKATTKTDINAVGSADTVGVKLAFSQSAPSATDFTLMDGLSGNIAEILISASATENDNKVYVLNRGTGGGIAARDYIKLRVLRNSNGYTLQYAPLTATTFSTVNISKNGEGDFVYVSLTDGSTVSAFPAKKDWDIEWTYSAYKYNYQSVDVMYPFSDLIAINHLNGVQAFSAEYADATIAGTAYTNFNKDSVSKYTYSSDRWVIGDRWRDVLGGKGIYKNKFYIIKDPGGNVYKLKFLAMGKVGTTDDGGVRGKPQIQYDLVK